MTRKIRTAARSLARECRSKATEIRVADTLRSDPATVDLLERVAGELERLHAQECRRLQAARKVSEPRRYPEQFGRREE